MKFVPTTFVTPGCGTPSKKIVSHLCLVSLAQPMMNATPNSPTNPPRKRRDRGRLFDRLGGKFIRPRFAQKGLGRRSLWFQESIHVHLAGAELAADQHHIVAITIRRQ